MSAHNYTDLHSKMAAKCINLGKETAAMLSEDLISEVLVRLPVKSLLRFRCVCKAWFHLIDSPNFIDEHLKHNKTKTDLILFGRNFDYLYDSLSLHAYDSFNLISQFYVPTFDASICEPCNGLVCALDTVNELTLLNLSMKRSLVLPPSPFPRRKGWNYDVDGFGFGFGFVSNTNDYKVIALINVYYVSDDDDDDDDIIRIGEGIIEDDNNNEHYVDHGDGEDDPTDKVEIYDLSTNSWREIEDEHPFTCSIDGDKNGTLFNGSLHWIARREYISIILAFEMSTEVFRYMELPSDLAGKSGTSLSLRVLDDSLALFECTEYNRNSEEEQFIDIWIMKEYAVTASWTKQVRIGPLSGIWNPLMLWKNKAILLESSERKLLSCALDTHEIEEVKLEGDEGSRRANKGSMRVMVYQESLVSLE